MYLLTHDLYWGPTILLFLIYFLEDKKNYFKSYRKKSYRQIFVSEKLLDFCSPYSTKNSAFLRL